MPRGNRFGGLDFDTVDNEIVVTPLINRQRWKFGSWDFVKTMSGWAVGWRNLPRKESGEAECEGVESKLAMNLKYYGSELLAAMAVVCAQVPETISFSSLAGVDAGIGLRGSWLMGIGSSIFFGRPTLIQGVSATMATLFVSSVDDQRAAPYVGIVMGVTLIIFSWLRLAFLVRFLSRSVMLGVFNGVAIVIAISQLHSFQTPDHEYVSEGTLGWSVFICFQALTCYILFAMIPTIGKIIAVPLALAFTYLTSWLVLRYSDTVVYSLGDIKTLSGSLSIPYPIWVDEAFLPPPTSEEWLSIAKGGIRMSAVVLMEILLTVKVLDDSEESNSNANHTIFACGIGNILVGFFGGLPSGLMIPMCMLLFKSGSKGKESGVAAAMFSCLASFFLIPVLRNIPAPGLSGVMFVVVAHTFNTDSVFDIFCTFLPAKYHKNHPKLRRSIPKMDALIILLVTVLVPLVSIDFAIFTGIFFSLIAFSNCILHEVQVFRHQVYIPNHEAAMFEENADILFDQQSVLATNSSSFRVAGQPEPTSDSVLSEHDPRRTTLLGISQGDLMSDSNFNRLNSNQNPAQNPALNPAPLKAPTFLDFVDLSDGLWGMTRVAVYDVMGPFYFSTSCSIRDVFLYDTDPELVFLRLGHSSIMDSTALSTLSTILSYYTNREKRVVVLKINDKCQKRINLAQAMLTVEKQQFEVEQVERRDFQRDLPDL